MCTRGGLANHNTSPPIAYFRGRGFINSGINVFIREGTEQCGIKVNYVKKNAFFFFAKALTHVRLHPINIIKHRKEEKTVNHPFKSC